MKLTEQQKELVENNINLIHHILKKYSFIKPATQDYDDYFQHGSYGLCLAAQRYNKDKEVLFSTFACSYISGYILRYYRDFAQGPIRRTRKQLNSKEQIQYVYYNDTLINSEGGETEIIEELQLKDSDNCFEDDTNLEIDFDKILKKFKERDKQIIIFLKLGLTQKEIGQKIGVSQAQVSRTRKKIILLLKKVI